ncbi:MAG TPA: hypothetical protein VD833_12975 [Vicinamibacterales bacterium]|nr:hypothetical protein [Vicinamibacterales bacterium]
MGDLYFDGDPEKDSTRRRLERVLKEESEREREREREAEPRPSRWPWKTTLLAGGTAFLWWQLRKRRLRRTADADKAAAEADSSEHSSVES